MCIRDSATTGTASGVYGITASTSGVGTLGTATAVSGSTFGVYGSTESPAGISVYGVASGGTGVLGNSASPTGIGVSANATGGGTALVATATGSGSAGLFTGNVKITGNLSVSGTVSKGGGSFRIDHPLDPEHKYLYHSFVESPDMMNIYNGVVVPVSYTHLDVYKRQLLGQRQKTFTAKGKEYNIAQLGLRT